MHCKHNIPETKKGAGPCDIRSEVKKRNGHPNWWCHTHGLDASAPDGAALDQCSGAWFDPVPDDMCHEIDLTQGETSVWGVIPAAIEVGTVPRYPGKVHVHHRTAAGAEKRTDESFEIVRLRTGDQELTVESMAAHAFALSTLTNTPVVALSCPHCGDVHIDELMFATKAHRKHQCNACGRNFFDQQPSTSNPLADAAAQLGLPAGPHPVKVNLPLDLTSDDFGGIAIWPSNAAIVSTMSRPEDIGIHVHAWDAAGALVIDDTYSPVTLDGELIDEDALRMLAVQRALSEGGRVPILNEACVDCGHSMLSPTTGWITPATRHTCDACGTENRTRRKSFLNALGDKRP